MVALSQVPFELLVRITLGISHFRLADKEKAAPWGRRPHCVVRSIATLHRMDDRRKVIDTVPGNNSIVPVSHNKVSFVLSSSHFLRSWLMLPITDNHSNMQEPPLLLLLPEHPEHRKR
jgi:hypothetical protein